MLIGVIAGTLIDTQMGVDFLYRNKLQAKGYPVSQTPKEQSRLQLLDKEILYKKVIELVKKAKQDGIRAIFVYCNSLSAAIDMEKVEEEMDIQIITPFTAYEALGKQYKSLMVLAANGQSCGKIEAALEESNKNIRLWSISALPLVEEIEKHLLPEEIYNNYNLKLILMWAEELKVEGIILGCTHFPYLKEVIEKETDITILDPGAIALDKIKKIILGA